MRDRVVSCPLARPLNRLSERRVECFVIDHVRSLVDAAGPFGPAAFGFIASLGAVAVLLAASVVKFRRNARSVPSGG